jgi:HlyD family secretion protein
MLAYQSAARADFSEISDRQLNIRLRLGLLTIALLLIGLGGWAANAKLSGAVIAPGTVVVDSHVKRVQHPIGGVVGQVLVKNGDAVLAGDVVLRLDDTQTRANLGVYTSQLDQLTGRRARLTAERDGAPMIAFPQGFETSSKETAGIAAGERRLFEAQNRATEGQKAQIREHIEQIKMQVQGFIVQRDAKSEELVFVQQELSRVSDLHRRHLIPETRLLAIQRDMTRIKGEHGTILAQVGSAGGQINELELKIISLDQTRQSDSQKELREIDSKIAELTERKISAEDQLKRIELRAPQSGVVHELSVHTVGGVIGPAETVMTIVPTADTLTVETHILPSDISEVKGGQKAMLRFTSFNQRTTPEIEGSVVHVSADLTREASKESQPGASYYIARIAPDAQAIEKLGGSKLVPGMPVDAFIETSPRTALSYLVKPFSDQLARAFRER